MAVMQIQKRDGSLVDFSRERIFRAIFLAANSVGGTDEEQSRELTDKVMIILNYIFFERVPDVETIQDIIEKVLIEAGHAKTAKAYILYRAQRTTVREGAHSDLLAKIKSNEAVITLLNNDQVSFDLDKIVEAMSIAAEGLDSIDLQEMILDVCAGLYNGVSVVEIEKIVINTARSKIELHTDYDFFVAKLLLHSIYKEVMGHSVYENLERLDTDYRNGFEDYIRLGVKDGQIDERLLDFDLKKLAEIMKPERDNLFRYLGIQTLYDRYLLKEMTSPHRRFELPQYMWLRVAMGVALNEKSELRMLKVQEFYDVMSQFLYMPSTPTLFNAGTTRAQLSSCFVNTVDDTLESIFKCYADTAMLSKFAGGIGTDWTNVRAMGAHIKGTNGYSLGTIPFLKIFNDVAGAVNQGGKRKGALVAYLETWHADIEDFLDARKNTGDERRRLHDAHTANWVPDLFMKRVLADKDWTLFSPSDVPDLHSSYGQEFEQKYEAYERDVKIAKKTIKAKILWRKMLTMLFETGHPWITFKDAFNVRSPQQHMGVIRASNLCTEIALNSSKEETAVCNLGSVNLSRMIKDHQLNEELLKTTIKTAVRILDNVIDINYYVIPETKNANMKHRAVGLGMMGYQSALYQMGINFASEEQVEFADRSMEMISYYAITASTDLAQEKGSYLSYKNSAWSQGIFPYDSMSILEQERGIKIDWDQSQTMDWQSLKMKVAQQGMRNSNLMAIAPTATISLVCGTTPCTEPTFRNIYVKENTSGSFILMNTDMVTELIEQGLWHREMINKIKMNNGSLTKIDTIPQKIRDKYQETFEIPSKWIIKSAARRSKWIDQSASTNIFLNTSSGKILNDTYMSAWKMGLKSTYYLRTLSKSQVEKTISIEDEVSQAIKTEKVSTEEHSTDKVAYNGVKLCKIEDPECEACQ